MGPSCLQKLSADNTRRYRVKYLREFYIAVPISKNVQNMNLCKIVTVLPAKSDSDVMFCLQSYQGLIIDRSLVY